MNRLPSKDAGMYLGYSAYTMKRSRTDGVLGGVASPAYIKIGHRVFYEKEILDLWLSQFKPQLNTAQNVKVGAV